MIEAPPSEASPRTGSDATRAPGHLAAVLLAFLLLAPLAVAGDRPFPTATTISIEVVRTSVSEASVIGFADGPGETIEVLVNGVVAATDVVSWTGEYWILRVPVLDDANVRTRIGPTMSPIVVVPPYVPQRVGPPGFIYAQGPELVRNGFPIALFGVNEATAFSYALMAWGYNVSSDRGRNQLFPSGPDTQIPGVTTPDEFWREYFRYFLHYKQTTDPGSPPSTLLRIWIVDLNWGTMAYDVWETDRATFYTIFDRMLYWAGRADVYIVPILGQNSILPADPALYERTSAKYARHLAFARDVMQHYDANPQIAMWDLWNEADVLNDVYWATVGGIDGYRAWLTGLVGDLRPSTANHLVTVGSAQWPDLPGLPTVFGVRKHFAFNNIPGIDVAHEHAYFSAEDQYLVDWRAEWGAALGSPYYVGEYGYNGQVLHPLGYGHWPWFTRQWRTSRAGPLSDMVFVDNGKGPYADYPYFGPLPAYPPEDGTNAPPQAAFGYSPPNPGVGDAVQFDGSSSSDDGGIVEYLWSFGDGQTGSGMVAPHAYAATGTYDVTLMVRDAQGLNDTAGTSVTVQPPPDTTPPARVTDLAVTGTQSDRVALGWTAPGDDGTTGQATWYDLRYSTSGPITGANFHLGIPYLIPFPKAPGSAETVNVTGLAPSTRYWFALRASDEVPNWSPVSNSVDGFTAANVTNAPPVAAFAVSPPAPRVGDAVQFDASASTDDKGIVQYLWNFGDGQSGSGVVATHAFTAGGTYNVTLTVSDAEGATDSAWALVGVDATPPTDDIPPARVTDLAVAQKGTDHVVLRWTASGDDGGSGRASTYDLRYSSQGPLNESTFPLAVSAPTPSPGPAGAPDTANVTGLIPGTRYWFGLRVADEVPNWAPLSNVVDEVTPTTPTVDTTPPTVGFSTPTNGSAVSGDVLVSAWAADDVLVSSVTFYVDGVPAVVRHSPPYEWTWTTGGVADGIHVLEAVAEDTSGNQNTATIEVTVRTSGATAPRVSSAAWRPGIARLDIVFSKPMDRVSVAQALTVEPNTGHEIRWVDDTRLSILLSGSVEEGRVYRVTITAGASDTGGTPMSEGFAYEFRTASPVLNVEFPSMLMSLGVLLGIVAIAAAGWGSRRHLKSVRIAASGLFDLGNLLEERGRPQVARHR